ncbi:carboxynorspermidine decarboxylase [Aquirufa sp. ROCK-SH2]
MEKQYPEIPSPCFVLEESFLLKNLELLKRVQDEAGIEIICALKGFSFYHEFPLVRKYLAGATASSLHEARLIVEEMKDKAHVYCPAFIEHEFEEMTSYASHITFNSITQYQKYIHKAVESQISCGIRINPEYSEIETDMYNPCVAGSRLGVRRSDLGDTLPTFIEGLHSHTMCENDSFVLERTLLKIEEKFGDFLPQLKWLNLGGGHLITKEGYDVEHLISLLIKFKSKYPNLQIVLEPGSAVGWQTGFLKSTILDIVHSAGINVAILDTSFAAHMPDTLEMPYQPRIRNAGLESEKGKFNYRFGGMTCLAGDYYGDYSFNKPLQIGDEIIFEDMIHYTMVKTTTFNGVNLPSIGKIDLQNNFHLFKRFGYESFKDRL